MRRTRLGNLFKFKPERGAGFEIQGGFYLSVMAARMPLPSIRLVVEPKGDGGAVEGFGVPLIGDKEDLDRPMERGTYAIATLDRKTVLRGMVISKEEAGFSPDGFLGSEMGLSMSDEARARMASTWTLVQLTFESYDPAVHPAVRFMYEIAARMAELSGGLVADPVSQVYKLPGEVLSPVAAEGFSVQDFIAVQSRNVGGQLAMFTLGMQKFGLPEFEILGVKGSSGSAAVRFLLGLCHGALRGKRISPGDAVGSKTAAFTIGVGGLDRGQWEGIPVLDVLPENTEDVNDALARWDAEN